MAESVVVHVEPGNIEITPGGSAVALAVRVVNATSIVDSFSIDVVGGEEWLLAPPTEVRLLPGAETTANLRLSIPADRFAAAGPRILSVRVRSAADSAIQAVVQLPTVVREVSGGLTMRLDPQVVVAGGGANTVVRVRNPGNAPVTLVLAAEEAKGLSAFAFEPATLTVPPRHEVAAAVAVATRRPMFGTEESRAFTIRAEDSKTSLSAAGTLLVRPIVSQRAMKVLKVLVGIIVALAIGGIALAMTMDKVDVPKVTGKPETEARQALEAAGFTVEVTTRSSAEIDPGLVIDQTPAAGQKAKKGSVVDLTVSAGRDQVEVPDVVGGSKAEATTTLRNAGLFESPDEVFSDKPAGEVLAQNPPAGQLVPEGSTVTITVSKGTEIAKVPNAVDKERAAAEKALADAGFVVTVVEEFSAEVEVGRVIRQDPAAGDEAAAGSTVTITVAVGVTLGNTVGMSQADAVSYLEGLGLTVTVKRVIDMNKIGVVVSQAPPVGSVVPPGSAVTISVGGSYIFRQ